MLKAELIDKRGLVVVIIRQVESWTHSLGGFITMPISWNISDDTVNEEKFFAGCAIKWDGCSSFSYYGEDYLSIKEDSYYHECGLDAYYLNFVSKLFAFEVAKKYMKDVQDMDDILYKTIDRFDIFDSYEIRYSEVDEENDEIYKKYLELEGGKNNE